MKVAPADDGVITGGGDPEAGTTTPPLPTWFKVVFFCIFLYFAALMTLFALFVRQNIRDHDKFCSTPGVMLASSFITAGGGGASNHSADSGVLQLAVDVEFPSCEEEDADGVHYDAFEASVVAAGRQQQQVAVARLPPFYANSHSIFNLRLLHQNVSGSVQDDVMMRSSADFGFQLLASFRRLNKKGKDEGHKGSIRAACHPVTIGDSPPAAGPLAGNLDCDVELL